jgi:uncharacterized protein YndB with AHSA1/START domain
MDRKVDVTVTRRVAAAPERAFDAWLDPAVAGKFLFATPTGQMIKVEIDPRVGGRFNFTDRRPGDPPMGGDIEHVGEYLELDRPRRLVFTFAVSGFLDNVSTVALDFAPASDGGTDITLTHVGVLEDFAERTAGGWGTIIERLNHLV